MLYTHDDITTLPGEPETISSPLPAFGSQAPKEDVDLVPSTTPEPSSITIPLYRLPAISPVDDDTVPSAAPQPSSIVVPLHRLPVTPISESDGDVPSAVPEPVSIKVPLSRLPATSTPESGDFVPSAVPEFSSIFPSPATSTPVEDGDNFIPSVVPEPSSIVVPLHRLPATAEGGDFVPSLSATESSSVIVPSLRLPATSADGDDYFPSVALEPSSMPLYRRVSTPLEDHNSVPSAAPEPSSIMVPLYRSGSTSLEDDHFVPSAAPEPSSIKVPLYKLPESASVEDDDRVPSTEPGLSSTTLALATSTSTAGGDGEISYGLSETILGTADNLPATELSTSENAAYSEFRERFSEPPEGSPSSIRLDGTFKEEIEAIVKWIEVDEVKKPLFIVLGQIGTGQATLLNAISQRSKAGGYYAANYSFSRTDPERNTPDRLVNTLTYQIAEAIPELRPYVARVIEAEPSVLDHSIEEQTQQLLLEPLRQLKADYPGFSVRPHIIIIDALDECGGLNDQIRVITTLARVLEQEHVPFLCLLSCDVNLPITHVMSTTHAALIHDQVILGKTTQRRRR